MIRIMLEVKQKLALDFNQTNTIFSNLFKTPREIFSLELKIN